LYKTSRDQSEILDLENLLSEIVAVFSHEAEEAEPTLQAAMLATTTRPEEYQEPRPTSVPGGAYLPPAHPNGGAKRRYDEDRPISANEPHLLGRILKALNDIKFEVRIIKKHACIP
jgi:hypothetical protein